MDRATSLTVLEITAIATRLLEDGGYKPVGQSRTDLPPFKARLYEDPYGIVALEVFETVGDLISEWTEAQGALVDVITGAVGQGEAKAWDGYLLLISPGLADTLEDSKVEDIRADTVRVRKIIATGRDIASASDVERVLLPLLPLGPELRVVFTEERGVLDLLPEILARRGVPRNATESVVAAFRAQKPLLEAMPRTATE